MAESAVTTIPDSGAATLIATGGESSETTVIVKVTGAETVYLGASDVDSTEGFPVAANATLTVPLAATEKLYACVEVTDPVAASEVTTLITSKGSIFAP